VSAGPGETGYGGDATHWSSLEVAAQKTLLRHLATSPLATAAPRGAAVEWVLTGVASNTHNGVAATPLGSESADEAIAETIGQLAGHPAIWHLGSDDMPPDLAERLIRVGCRPERTGVVMGAATAAVPRIEPSAMARTEEVTTAEAVRRWQ
jgi:hypothetical protein